MSLLEHFHFRLRCAVWNFTPQLCPLLALACLSIRRLGFLLGGHLSQVTSLRGRQPTAVRPLHAVFLPHQPAVPQASLSAHSPQVTCSCTRVLVPAGGRGPLSCTARLFPDLTCSQPPLPPPFLPAVGAPGSPLLKELLA